ncbi:MAG: RHH-type transcriptional regulator, proline utilization regulon repressor / proline dehydrogenase [Betaproteobacteria bacterium]|jgi:RHH-type proline utilization regulon transcriptional repressor/proline dehydrogenase/delta 1-pyrroline-5-carboxylate dehydrogenase|nr:RHH-type transcriptional regulator, proline utilization regulon repressor / proline dehydrogenase [Betaproteobacteria bacterium]
MGVDRLRAAIAGSHRTAEADAVRHLRARQPGSAVSKAATDLSFRLAERVRATPPAPLSAESFLRQYGLSTPEGVALMCVAEALLRIPDAGTADALLREKLASGNWSRESAADWALLLTGTLVRWHDDPSTLKNLISRLGEPVVRTAVKQAMRILAGQFVLGETIEQAVSRAAGRPRFRFSYDMLGEAARTAEDAARYFTLYSHAIKAVRPPDGVSVKLSALHPRFEEAKRSRVLNELVPLLRNLSALAADRGVGMTIDAEESERLELTLDILESVPDAGLAVQAYQKRALAVCEWLVALGRSKKRRIPIRLVKGAYWDGEVKRAQQLGMPDYPVFTRKAATDVSYVACATTLLSAPEAIHPAFATHNCRTLATILEIGKGKAFEFQKLFGMGDALYDIVLADHPDVQCRVYAPVGSFTDLLPYLVRRLLENGANASFVHQIADPKVPLQVLVADPMSEPVEPDPRIPLPRELYPDRKNSIGLDLSVQKNLDDLKARIRADGALAPADPTSPQELDFSLARASEAFESWSRTPASQRAALLERAAALLEQHMVELASLVVREGRRTYGDAVSEVREAADFCRYYALQAKQHFDRPLLLSGPAGEKNELFLHGRGVFACISPWNFPLAIFTGQVAAALAAGNTVIAKPAEQTPRTGMRALEILYQAGIPADVACCAIGDGSIGARLVDDPRIAGVAFTGSVETARRINQALAGRDGPIVPLIAETGGVNAMLVDSSALPEQVVDDTIASAFQSAGQRCSAQRILFLDAGNAPRTLELLRGALAELKVGDPAEPDTDIGPVIDADAHQTLRQHVERLRKTAQLIGEAHAPATGHYIAPIAFELKLEQLPKIEVFGPVLHVCIYQRDDLDRVLAWLRDTGFGLTLGIHSRLQSFVDQVVAAARVGNIYVNRSMIGAVVGVQPFGGEGLSGTGPKAGGPHYMLRFATERTLTVNTAAIGGVTELLSGR